MSERAGARSKLQDLARGLALGLLVGLVAKDLDLGLAVSFFADRSLLATASMLLGGALALTPLRGLLALAAVVLVGTWLVVAWTPVTHWLSEGLPRRDPLSSSDAVFVLASSQQPDGDLTAMSMSRLLHGMTILADGWAPRLILTEAYTERPRYRDAACALMESFGLTQEVISVGPVGNTHDEAVAVSEVARDFGLESIIVVTSPAHSRRASAALEAQGVRAISSPSPQPLFDYEGLHEVRGDPRTRAFGYIVHEYAGLWYYRLRGWLGP